MMICTLRDLAEFVNNVQFLGNTVLQLDRGSHACIERAGRITASTSR